MYVQRQTQMHEKYCENNLEKDFFDFWCQNSVVQNNLFLLIFFTHKQDSVYSVIVFA